MKYYYGMLLKTVEKIFKLSSKKAILSAIMISVETYKTSVGIFYSRLKVLQKSKISRRYHLLFLGLRENGKCSLDFFGISFL